MSGSEANAGRTAQSEVTIQATPERVWQALTEAAELERWFPLEARVEPGEGGTMHLSWRNEFAGDLTILTWDPPRRLRTAWAFHEHDETAPQVTDYEITAEDGGMTRVRVVTSGFPDDPSWDGWVEGTRRGWRYELRSLKHYLERFPGQDREVIYLRRRVNLPDAEAWARLFPAGGSALPHLSGTPFDDEPGKQYAAIADHPEGAVLRVSLEPTGMGTPKQDVTLWMSAWGGAADNLRAIEGAWNDALEKLFPEGERV